MAFLHHPPSRVVGLDIAKHTITLVDSRAPAPRVIDNEPRAIRALLKTCDETCLVLCEPTGGHERTVLAEACRAGIPCHRADTLKLKAFIRSFGTLGKTDAIDAARIADYGRERWRTLPLWTPPTRQAQTLVDLVRRRHDLVALRVAERNRAKAPGAAPLAASFEAMLTVIGEQIAKIDTAIDEAIASCPDLVRRSAICTAMPGIGQKTAAALLAHMPELGQLSRRQAAALAGLAPHPNDSGLLRGHRRIKGGRPEVRTVLFMPALSAARGCGEFASFYQRLVQNGKNRLAAIAALMRKIIVVLNARLQTT